MSNAKYHLLFAGDLTDGSNPTAVRARIMQRFGLDVAAVDRLFSGKRVFVKRDADAATARRIRDAFHAAGARLILVPLGNDDDAAPASGNDAPSATPGQGLTLAPPGALLEEIDDRGQPRTLDISHLDLLPGNDWTFEDCTPPPPRHSLPDTSHLSLVPLPKRQGTKTSDPTPG